MATPVLPGDLLLVKVGCYNAGQAGINVLWYNVDAVAGGSVFAAEIAETLSTEFANVYKAYMGNTATFYGVSVQVRLNPPFPTPAVWAGDVGPGLIAGGCLPGQVCGMLTKETQFAGRAFRGRVFLPFPGESLNDAVSNSPTIAGQALMDAVATKLNNPYTVGTAPDLATIVPVLVSADGVGFERIEDFKVRAWWGTQRSRGNLGAKNPYPPF